MIEKNPPRLDGRLEMEARIDLERRLLLAVMPIAARRRQRSAECSICARISRRVSRYTYTYVCIRGALAAAGRGRGTKGCAKGVRGDHRPRDLAPLLASAAAAFDLHGGARAGKREVGFVADAFLLDINTTPSAMIL